MFTYNPDTGKKLEYDCHIGVIGEVIKLKEAVIKKNPRNDPMINLIVDIDSTLPIMTMPIV